MRVDKSGTLIDNPSGKLLDWFASYEGVASANGAAGGTTIVCADLVNHADYTNYAVKVLDTAAAGQILTIISDIAGVLTVAGFTDAAGAPVQIVAGTRFIILSFNLAGIVAVLASLGVPAPDAPANALERDVIGNKTSTAIYVKTATADVIRYLKGLIDAGIAISGTVVDGAPAVTDFDTSIVEVTNNHYNGGLLLFLAGPNAGQSHLIDVYTGANGNVSFATSDQWTDVPVNGNAFIVIPNLGAYLKKIFTAIGLTALAATALTNATWTDLLAAYIWTIPITAMRGTDNAALAADWTNALATALGLDSAPTAVGKSQIKATTIDLAQAAGTYDLFTATTQDVVVEKLVIRMSGGTLVGSNCTSILIQTDDATAIVLIDAVAGAVANLTNEAQLTWTGAILLDAGTGAKIRVTIAGGAATAAKICDVIAECRAVIAGGTLA